MQKSGHIKQIILMLSGLAIFLSLSSAFAMQEDTSALTKDKVSLQHLIAYAYNHNPRLKAAKMRWAATIDKYPQINAYKDPTLQYSYFIENIETRVGPQEHKFSIAQEIPFPGKLGLEGEIVEEEIKIAQLEFEKQTRDLIVELKSAYYELAYISGAIELTKQNKELLEHLANIGTTEYSVDGTTLNDVFQAQSQLAQVSYDLIFLSELKSSEITRINTLLNRPPEAPLAEPQISEHQALSKSLDELYKLALKNQQELGISELDIAKQSKKVELAEMTYLPNFKVGMDYISVGNAANPNVSGSGQDAYAVNLGISIPLWFDKNRARVNEAKHEHDAAVYKKEDLKNSVFANIKAEYFKLQNSERLVRLYTDSLIPQAAQSMETAETWFKTKKGSFANILETQAVWLNFNLALQRALADYQQQLAALEKLVGTNLVPFSTTGRDTK